MAKLRFEQSSSCNSRFIIEGGIPPSASSSENSITGILVIRPSSGSTENRRKNIPGLAIAKNRRRQLKNHYGQKNYAEVMTDKRCSWQVVTAPFSQYQQAQRGAKYG